MKKSPEPFVTCVAVKLPPVCEIVVPVSVLSVTKPLPPPVAWNGDRSLALVSVTLPVVVLNGFVLVFGLLLLVTVTEAPPVKDTVVAAPVVSIV